MSEGVGLNHALLQRVLTTDQSQITSLFLGINGFFFGTKFVNCMSIEQLPET